LTPTALALNRLMIAEAQRFPELATTPRAWPRHTPMTEPELDIWEDDCVNLFLNGCRSWRPPAQ
jgi:hypothetical protein